MNPTIPPLPTVEDTSIDHEDDIAAIRQVIADIEIGFNRNGETIDVGHSMVALHVLVYVLVNEDDSWWVAARQNSLVPK